VSLTPSSLLMQSLESFMARDSPAEQKEEEEEESEEAMEVRRLGGRF
jgi:hypothetical protein